MHYKNGHEVHEGDHVITKSYNGKIVGGVVYDLVNGNTSCNCSVASIIPGGNLPYTCQDVGEMYDVRHAFAACEILPILAGKLGSIDSSPAVIAGAIDLLLERYNKLAAQVPIIATATPPTP